MDVKGATSQVAGSSAVLDRIVTVLDRTVIVLDRAIIVLDRSVIAIYGILSLNFPRPGGGSDRLWLLHAGRHPSAPALPTLSILSGDRYVNKTLPRAGLFPGARSCAFKQPTNKPYQFDQEVVFKSSSSAFPSYISGVHHFWVIFLRM